MNQRDPKALETDRLLEKNKSANRRTTVGEIPWNYDRSELIADGAIHVVGVGMGLGATTTLIVLTSGSSASIHPVIVTGYALCLLSMLVFSAAYNLCPVSPRKWLLRRFDQSAIYLLIAATYTPFITQFNDRDLAASLLVAIWSAAAVGTVLRLLFPDRFERLSLVLYIAMGWSGIIVYDKAVASLSGSILTFIATGGVLYTLGVIFHLWKRLHYQNAIWHAFVLLGAACHFNAVWNLAVT
ncbi:PAQR family membrane homeostasis protein TrhA [Nitrobacter vulgaris]|uniref:PAQR family membrane homeostasis protein TrhA n=1 Tax=Nitrobacter vulgaris TaxID=29421 RepID=UPI0035B54AD9